MGPVAARRGERQGDFLAGKYLLEDCLGIGGMGEVYRATNMALGRKVAIKLLSPSFVKNEDDVIRFLREARAAATVRHANVVDVLDVSRDDDGTPFIVQELLSGEDLEKYMRSRGTLDASEALEIMIPIADAVATAHAHEVVHRDLKPANILLSRERNKITPKVLDFGACLFPTLAERSQKEKRMLIGTPHYMAPEQIVSKDEVDARSDVWAIGIILYEMLVGESPFEADSMNAVLELVKTVEVPLLRSKVPGAPAELEELIAQCTRRERLARLENAGAVLAGMERVRARMRGGRPPQSRIETIAEFPAQRAPAPVAPPPSPHRLMTLSSPGSEPPPSMLDDLDIALPAGPSPAPAPVFRVPSLARSTPSPLVATAPTPIPPPSRSSHPPSRSSATSSIPPSLRSGLGSGSLFDPSGIRTGDSFPQPAEDDRVSSLPPILDPRVARQTSDPPAYAPLSQPPSAPRELARPADVPHGPPAVRAKDFAAPREHGRWSGEQHAKLFGSVIIPAVILFLVVRFVPALGYPIGRALRGDSTLASGVLTVIALIVAAAICARAFLGDRERFVYVAAAGSIVFGVVMIIVTSSASEAATLGEPHAMGGVAMFVAPIAPIALHFGAIWRARAAWLDPYSRREAATFAALSSVMLFFALVLSPIGAVRTAPKGTSTAAR